MNGINEQNHAELEAALEDCAAYFSKRRVGLAPKESEVVPVRERLDPDVVNSLDAQSLIG